jgi:hypothetical protein
MDRRMTGRLCVHLALPSACTCSQFIEPPVRSANTWMREVAPERLDTAQYGSVISAESPLCAATTVNAANLDNIKTIAEIVHAGITAAAIVFGGLWAYFKFVKGRTYRPRLSVAISGQWRRIAGKNLLHTRVTVKNIGASVVTLQKKGSGLRVNFLAAGQPDAPTAATWEVVRVFDILREHVWIEPGETVSDDQLLDLDIADPTVTLFEVRLGWSWSGQKKEIVVHARKVIPVESTIDGDEARRS